MGQVKFEQHVTFGYLEVTQARFQGTISVSASLPMLDVLLLSSSWEPRCLEVSKLADLRARFGLMIKFSEHGSSGRRGRHDEHLAEWLRTCCQKGLRFRSVSATEERQMFEEIRMVMRRIFHLKRGPYTMLIDASCLPKVYLLTILAFGFRSGYLSEALIFYSQADYSGGSPSVPGPTSEANISYQFTEGNWRGVIVPYLDRWTGPGQFRAMIVSLGFEGRKLMEFVRNYDPDRMIAFISDPGFTEEYTRRARAENEALLKSQEISQDRVEKLAAGDVLSVFRRAQEIARAEAGTSHLSFLCLGTKPHALGLGLAALASGNVSVIVRMPERFVEKDTKASGINWIYRIRDLSSC